MTLVRSLLVIVLGGALILTPGPALADRATQRDPVGDVARAPIGSNIYTPIPTQIEGDITATRVVHAPRAVWIRVKFRELTASTNGNFHLVGIKSDRRFRLVTLNAFPGHWDGAAVTTNARGRAISCGVAHHLDYDRNLLIVKMPRSCLGKPDWVRVGTRSTVAGVSYAYADDAHAVGFHPGLVYGSRVRH
jgi:hypothetical protein